MIRLNILSVVIIALLVACERRQPVTQQKIKVETAFPKKDTITQQQQLSNTIERATEVFPESRRYELWLLEPVNYHTDEVESKAVGYEWYGLFKTDSNTYYVAKTTIIAKRVNDVIIDNKGEKSGWSISTPGRDSALILISGMQLPKQPTEMIAVGQSIKPGKEKKITYQGTTYTFYATGKTPTNKYEPLYDYRLYMKTKINDKEYKQLLFSAKGAMEITPYIYFIADIDGDGIPDVVMDTSYEENTARVTLYLSSPVYPSSLLKPMGMQISVGC